jgi:hypothetical protein
VILQDTGFSRVLPTGKGLFAFSTADEAVAHVQAVKGNYGAHARAAHAIAAEFFDSGKILADLLERAGSA